MSSIYVSNLPRRGLSTHTRMRRGRAVRQYDGAGRRERQQETKRGIRNLLPGLASSRSPMLVLRRPELAERAYGAISSCALCDQVEPHISTGVNALQSMTMRAISDRRLTARKTLLTLKQIVARCLMVSGSRPGFSVAARPVQSRMQCARSVMHGQQVMQDMPTATQESCVRTYACLSCSLRAAWLAAAPTRTNFSTHDTFSLMSWMAGPCTSPPLNGAPIVNRSTNRACTCEDQGLSQDLDHGDDQIFLDSHIDANSYTAGQS